MLNYLIETSRSRRAHGGHDAAARVHDLHVRRARDTLLKFVGAIARKDHMRVRINEARHHHAAACVEDSRSGVLLSQLIRRAKIDDRVARRRDCTVFDQAEIAQSIAALRASIMRRDGQQLRSVGDEEIDVHAVIIA